MYVIRFDVDKDQNKPILIPQYRDNIRIFRSKHDENKLVANDNHETWEFNKFDILTGIGILTSTITVDELKERYKNRSNSKTKKYIRKFIKFHIRMLKKLLDYFN